jgi:carbon monoxide dehydrogenase subunit G
MTELEASVEMKASAQAVWDVLTDFDLLGEWLTVHDGFPEPPGTLQPGMEFRQRLSSGDIEGEVDWVVDAVEPPSHLAWSGSGPAGSKARVSYLIEERDESTTVVYRTELELPGLASGLAATAVRPKGQEEAARALERLRDLVERRREGPGRDG